MYRNLKIIAGVIITLSVIATSVNYNLSKVRYIPEFKKVVPNGFNIEELDISILNPLKENLLNVSSTEDKALILDIIQNARASKSNIEQANTYYHFIISNRNNNKKLTMYLSENQIILNNHKYNINNKIFKKVDKLCKKYYIMNKSSVLK